MVTPERLPERLPEARPERLSERPPSIPHEAATAAFVTAPDGVRLRLYELKGGRRSGPALLWGHANGFAAGSYLPMLQDLAGHCRLFAFDARAHGGSDLPPEPLPRSLHIDRFARDVGVVARAVRERIGAEPLFFASHSFSGVAALRLAAVFGETPWAAMTLFEPPLMPTSDLPEHAAGWGTSLHLVALARRRRRRWASPRAYADSLAGRPPFSGFRRDMLAAHCRATLRPTGEGDFALCCPPEAEAAIYMSVVNATTFRALPNVAAPVHFVAGDPVPAEGPPSWAAQVQGLAAARTPRARLTVMEGAGHLMPFERPDACRDLVLEMLSRPGGG